MLFDSRERTPWSTRIRERKLTCHSTSKNADDIVITLAIRTPLTKARKGGFKDSSLEYIIYALLKEVRERSNLDPALVEDICAGNVRWCLFAGCSLFLCHFI